MTLTDEAKACCAHMRVTFRPIYDKPGHVVEHRWLCTECQGEFVPISEANRLRVEVARLQKCYDDDVREAEEFNKGHACATYAEAEDIGEFASMGYAWRHFDEVRKENAAIRERGEDLETLWRFVVGACGCGDIERDDNGEWMICLGHKIDDLRLKDDGTGLPLLTAEARAALKEAR